MVDYYESNGDALSGVRLSKLVWQTILRRFDSAEYNVFFFFFALSQIKLSK